MRKGTFILRDSIWTPVINDIWWLWLKMPVKVWSVLYDWKVLWWIKPFIPPQWVISQVIILRSDGKFHSFMALWWSKKERPGNSCQPFSPRRSIRGCTSSHGDLNTTNGAFVQKTPAERRMCAVCVVMSFFFSCIKMTIGYNFTMIKFSTNYPCMTVYHVLTMAWDYNNNKTLSFNGDKSKMWKNGIFLTLLHRTYPALFSA